MKAVIVLAALVLAGCGDKKAPAPAGEPAPVAAESRPMLVARYEAVRDGLAKDEAQSTRVAATALAAGAEEPAVKAAAEKVASAPNIEAARLAFGELSKAYLEVLAKKPELAKGGLFAFRCPMAEGYQKWVQLDETMKNPYMGKRMLECGSKTELVP